MEALIYSLLLVMASIFSSKVVHGSGVVSVKLENFINPGGKTADDQCCDKGVLTCSSRCDHVFHVCLNDPNVSPDASSCSVGEFQTDVIKDANEIQFQDKIGDADNPRQVPFESWAESIELKIKVKDLDEALKMEQLVDDFKETLSITPSKTAEPQELILLARTNLFLKISVSCDDDYYGPGCTAFCKPSESDNYDCGPDGEKICREGEKCEVRTIPYACASSPCHSDATCQDVGASFKCVCPVERKGEFCETWIPHKCDEEPCQGGGTCIRIGQAYMCNCQKGYYDVRCNRKMGTGAKSYKQTGAANKSSASMNLIVLLSLMVMFILRLVQ